MSIVMNGLDRRRTFENIRNGVNALQVWVEQEDKAMDETLTERDALRADLARVEAENAALQAALEPFTQFRYACTGDDHDLIVLDAAEVWPDLIHAAKAALAARPRISAGEVRS
jgi:hypothetical protein